MQTTVGGGILMSCFQNDNKKPTSNFPSETVNLRQANERDLQKYWLMTTSSLASEAESGGFHRKERKQPNCY